MSTASSSFWSCCNTRFPGPRRLHQRLFGLEKPTQLFSCTSRHLVFFKAPIDLVAVFSRHFFLRARSGGFNPSQVAVVRESLVGRWCVPLRLLKFLSRSGMLCHLYSLSVRGKNRCEPLLQVSVRFSASSRLCNNILFSSIKKPWSKANFNCCEIRQNIVKIHCKIAMLKPRRNKKIKI